MVLTEYSSSWINDFEALKGELEIALNGIACTIEHVGSTSS
ncbi:GrpB family protein [Daejeonella sp.]